MTTTLIILVIIALIGARLYLIYRETMRRVDAYMPPSQGVVFEYSRGCETMKLTIPPGTPKEEMQAIFESFRAGLGDSRDVIDVSGKEVVSK